MFLVCMLLLTGCNKPAEPIVVATKLASTADLVEYYGVPDLCQNQVTKGTSGMVFKKGNITLTAEVLGNRIKYMRYAQPTNWTDVQINQTLASITNNWHVTSTNKLANRIVTYTNLSGYKAKYSGHIHWLEIWLQ